MRHTNRQSNKRPFNQISFLQKCIAENPCIYISKFTKQHSSKVVLIALGIEMPQIRGRMNQRALDL